MAKRARQKTASQFPSALVACRGGPAVLVLTSLAAAVAASVFWWVVGPWWKQVPITAAHHGGGYDSEGAVWNERLAHHTLTSHGGLALRRAQRLCGADSLVVESAGKSKTEIVDAALQRIEVCGSVAVGPGMLPRLSPEALAGMAKFGREVLSQGRSGQWRAEELLPKAHSHRRGDMWPPVNDGPFGKRLLHALTDLGPLLRRLLGEDVALDFISVLYALPGSTSQGWHAEGRDPERRDGDRLQHVILKVQVLLHSVTPSMGSIHFLSHNQSGMWAQHTAFAQVAQAHRIVPPRLGPGSVILYNPSEPVCMHAATALVATQALRDAW
jgi:hypothetical protein